MMQMTVMPPNYDQYGASYVASGVVVPAGRLGPRNIQFGPVLHEIEQCANSMTCM